MFTPKNIQGALEELYDLCDPDYMVDMLVNYSEEFDDISPTLLARSFQKNAEMVCEYRVLSSAGEGIDYQGTVLLNSRAVRLLSYVEDTSGNEKVRTIQSKELWLTEDMTFYVVSCMSTITMDKEEAICLNEHRSVVTTVECEDDIFFDMGSLICELDDILDYLEHYEGSMVCSRQLYSEALGNDGNPAQWEIREINDIMNNCSNWIAFSNPRHFPEPYRRQKGWEKPDNRGQDFQPITKEQMEQLSLPPEWMER